MNTEKRVPAPETIQDAEADMLDDSVEGHVNFRPLDMDGGGRKRSIVSPADDEKHIRRGDDAELRMP